MLPLTLTFPWILALLAGVPLLWRLLRAAPPPPRTLRFPGVFFLYGLENRAETPGVTPLWLLALRTLLLVVLVLAATGPVWRGPAAPAPATRPLIVLIDNSATASPVWRATLDAADSLITGALEAGRPVFWTALAPARDGTLPHGRPGSHDWTRTRATLTPQPWLADIPAVQRLLTAAPWPEAPDVWLLSSGFLPRPFGEGWLRRITHTGAQVQVLAPPSALRAQAALTDLAWDGDTAKATLTLLRPAAAPLHVELQNRQGDLLASAPATLPAAEGTLHAVLRLPPAQAASIRQARIGGESALTALWLTGGGWGAPPVGLLSGKEASQTRSLLDELHYLRQALSMSSRRTVTGNLEALLTAGSRVILWPDAVVLSPAERTRLAQFVRHGGALVRFAGERLASARGTDTLLPVRLRPGKRALGGALGEAPPRLTGFAGNTPLSGLPVPGDVTITTSVLPEPVADLPMRVWAGLSDGTPLVTGRREGRGWLVLVQTSATPAWGTLVYSGVFPALLGQLVELGQGGVAVTGATLPPWRLLTADGHLTPPPPGTADLPMAAPLPPPGPLHPPGLYGDGGRVALNLGPEAALRLAPVEALWDGPLHTTLQPEERLAPVLLLAAFALLLADGIATLALGGALRHGAGRAAVAAVLLLLLPGSSRAEVATGEAPDFLAYLPTGNPTVDQVTEAGLAGLTRALTMRTAAELAPPRALRGDAPELPLAPLVFWAMAADSPPLTPAEEEGLRRYLQHGGLLFIDTRSAAEPLLQAARMETVRGLLADLGVPDVAPIPKDHILSRTFYLLERFPGRWTAGTLAVPVLPEDLADPVAPVVVGSNDYAAAWAVNAAGNPLVPALPQGTLQREHALRTGVNVVLYALTGTYKNDQIHLKAILERLE